ncbi:hypothetical protein NLY39_03450 [Pseudomonas sp. KHPS1]|nr:hypothetical protein [Pseudomonas sp. KHPS1]UTH37229.1 hypothetical protein NLY39_03450 [Pseudomonas sp. KHPS1]
MTMISGRSMFLPGFFIGARLAVYSRYIWLLCGGVLIMAVSVLLAAQFSGRQPATVALDFGLSVIRLLGPLLVVLIVQGVLSCEFDRRHFLLSISYPGTRSSFFLGRFVAVFALVVFALLMASSVLALLVWVVGMEYAQGTPVSLGAEYIVTVAFISLDLLLLTALACFLAVVASSASFVLIGTLGFMLVARSYSGVIELLNRDAGVVANPDSYRSGVGVLGYFLPDLGALDIRMIALYGRMEFLPSDWLWLVSSSAAYVLGVLAMSVWAINHKRFN